MPKAMVFTHTHTWHSYADMGDAMAFTEPELPEIPEVDRPVVRNVIYTAWALHANGNPCIGWQVQPRYPEPIV